MDSRHDNLLLRLWNDVTSQSRIELVSPLARDEVVRRLAAGIDSGWEFFGRKPVVGKVGKETFRLRWRIKYRSSFQTVLFGTFVEHGRGTRLKCRTGMHPIVSVFMAVWLSGVVAVTLTDPRDLASKRYVVLVILFVFSIAFVAVWRWFARNERDHLIEFLGRVVDARPA